MKVLVTGGAGFIGSHVVDAYLESGYDVVVVDDLSTGRVSNLNPDVRLYELDIRSPQLSEVFRIERPDFVNHHAAQMDVRKSVEDPVFDANVNIVGSLNVIQCSIQSRVKKLVYISSGGAVYGEPEYLPCDERHPINPICQYGVSKHTVEHYLYLYRENYALEYAVLRYPNVFGPRQDPNGEAGVVAIFVGKMLGELPLVINGDGEQRRDFAYVADCAYANVLAVQRPEAQGIYNLGSGTGTSVNEIFESLKALTAYDLVAEHGPPKLGETRKIFLSAEKAKRELGWEASVPLDEGLRRTVEYFKESEVKV